MSTLSPQDVSHLARLARLDLTPEEQERFAGQLSSVVGYIDQLSAVDVSELVEFPSASRLQNVLAADELRQQDDPASIDSSRALAASPRPRGRFFTVQAVLSDEGGAA